jgi:hypothetical protein
MNRNVLATVLATVAVLVVVILGFVALGGPSKQRLRRSDLMKIQEIAKLAEQINQAWRGSNQTLPANLDKFPESLKKDLAINATLIYRPKGSSQYEICAPFSMDNRSDPNANTADPWLHPSGDYCFQFDSTQPVPQVPYYYGY